MKKIAVIGANGQLGLCIQQASKNQEDLDFIFLDSKTLNITNQTQTDTFFITNHYDYCINCAAYTAVDHAEDEKERAFNINSNGACYLAKACNNHNTTLIHISTDFVFNGNQNKPYKEDDPTNPIGVYGASKREGEIEIIKHLKQHIIIRTSWLYSNFGNNFVKTMLRLAETKKELNIVNDQTGTPTNANDLADVIISIIKHKTPKYGIYHYSNLGQATWYAFAKELFKQTNTTIKLTPVTSSQFITKAKRPKYSVLDKTKIINTYQLDIPEWQKSLKKAILFLKH